MVNYTPDLKKNKKTESKEIPVQDIMKKSYPCFKAEDSVQEAMKILLNEKLSGAPVIDQDRHPVGFLSEKDCLRVAIEMKYHNSPPGKVASYMTKDILSMEPSTSILKAIELFIKYAFHCYPVVDQGKVVGVIDRRSVLNMVNKWSQTTWYRN